MLSLSLSVIAVITFISVRQSSSVMYTNREIEHTQKSLDYLNRISAEIVGIQNDEEIYAATGDKKFLADLTEKEIVFADYVEQLSGGNHSAEYNIWLDSLKLYFEKRVSAAHADVNAYHPGKAGNAATVLSSYGDKELNDKIISICDRLREIESASFAAVKEGNYTGLRNLNILLYTVLGFVLVLSFVIHKRAVKSYESHMKGRKKFSDLFQSAPDATMMINSKGAIIMANREAARLSGYSDEELMNMQVEMLIPHESRNKHTEMRGKYHLKPYERNIHSGLEQQLLTKDGKVLPVEISLSPIKSQNEATVIAAIRDISERKKTEDEIRSLYAQINQTNEAVYLVDREMVIRTWNKGAEKLYGYKMEEAVGRNSLDLLQTSLSPEEYAEIYKVISTTDFWKGKITRKNKAGDSLRIYSSVSAVRGKQNEITGYVSVSYDITESEKIQAQINYLASVVGQSGDAIISVDNNRKILSWNKGAEQLHQYTAEEVLGKNLQDLNLADLTEEDFRNDMQMLFRGGKWDREAVMYRKDGSSFFGVITGNLLKDEKEDIKSVIFVAKDITVRKKMEDQLYKYNTELESMVQERTEKLSKSEREYRRLFENNPMPMIVFGQDNLCINDANEAAVSLYGFSKEEFMNLTVLDIRPPEDREKFIHKIVPIIDTPDFNREYGRM